MRTLTRWDIQGGDDAGIFPEECVNGEWCCATEAHAAIAELEAELAAPVSVAKAQGVVLTDEELCSIRNQVACNEVRRDDDSRTICVKHGRALEAAVLARLNAAQAIIDGLRGEVEALQSTITDLSKTGIRMRAERDNQARRAGELEASLEFACKSLAQVTSSDGSGHADIAVSVLRMAGRKEADASQIVEAYKAGAKWRIDAALSAGKEKQDEHS